MPQPEQSAANHAQYVPMYHFFAFPVLLIHAVWATVPVFRAPGVDTIRAAVVAWALAVLALAARVMALTVQDRLIRHEETHRLERLLPASQHPEIARIGRRQFVALRFASDDELPSLFQRVLTGELTDQKSIKGAIRNWRPDYFRA